MKYTLPIFCGINLALGALVGMSVFDLAVLAAVYAALLGGYWIGRIEKSV